MEGNIFISGQIGSYDGLIGVELIDIITQVKKQPEATSFNVYINSEGGLVDTGFDIYNYLKTLGLPVKTIGNGLVASIATVIFMAGSQRTIKEGTKFMIHLPWGEAAGTADDIEDYAKEIRNVEERLVKFYSEITNTSKEAIRPLLRNETWLSTEQLKDLGFTNMEQPLPIAAKVYLNKNHNNMANLSKEDKSWLENLISSITNSFKKPIKNIMLQDANGVTLDFPEIEEGQDIVVGTKVNVDGSPAEGEYVMPTGETYVCVGGEITEIKEPSSEGGDEEMQALKDENENLKKQVEELTAAKTDVESKLETEIAARAKFEKETKKKLAEITSKFELDSKEDKPKEDTQEPKRRTLLKQE